MMMVKTYLAPSPIQGLGLFAEENIKKGQLIWSFVEGFDRLLEAEQIAALPPLAQQFVDKYGFAFRGKTCLSADNDRFVNHSDSPNTAPDTAGDWFAIRDIAQGEEITADYVHLDDHWQGHF